MEPTLITLEPERQNALLKWWSEPEAATLLGCLGKSHKVALLKAATMQAKSAADTPNPNLKGAAEEILAEANAIETTIRVLTSFFPDGPFIARIEL